MKHKAFLVFFIALLVLAANLVIVSADTVNVDIVDIEVDGFNLGEANVISAEPSQVVPVIVKFTANEDLSNVRVKAYVEGYKSEISDQTSEFHIENGSTYTKRLSLELPSTFDFDDLSEELSLYVRISARGMEAYEDSVDLKIQRDLYGLNFLSIDMTDEVVPGENVVLDVVVENNGFEELENVYIEASIPELGVSRRIFAGDIDELDERDFDCDDEDCRDLGREDTRNKRIYLPVPRNAAPGVYDIVVEAYNYDTATTATKRVIVNSVETGVMPSVTAKTISEGEEATFDVVLINPNDRMVVYTITPEESTGLIVEVLDPIVTVPADSSRTAKVRVKATSSAEEGTHLVTVNVNSESELVRQVDFTVNVEEGKSVAGISTGTSTNAVTVLTVILVIIFVVLLIVLIVLLTKKPEEPEEFGETSYY